MRCCGIARGRLTAPATAFMALAFCGALATGGFVFYNTNILNHYLPTKTRLDRQAELREEVPAVSEDLPSTRASPTSRPTSTSVPTSARSTIRGRYTLREQDRQRRSDRLHLSLNPR